MNFFEAEVLKGKYFIPKSRDRLRATMVNLFILVGAFIMLLYAYENLTQGYYVMLMIELIIVFILMVAYLIFPHYVTINQTSYMILGALTFLLSMSLIVPDQDPELSLFWLASLPLASPSSANTTVVKFLMRDSLYIWLSDKLSPKIHIELYILF